LRRLKYPERLLINKGWITQAAYQAAEKKAEAARRDAERLRKQSKAKSKGEKAESAADAHLGFADRLTGFARGRKRARDTCDLVIA
jgi:hypothetical protein